jgi:hypothetical protein
MLEDLNITHVPLPAKILRMGYYNPEDQTSDMFYTIRNSCRYFRILCNVAEPIMPPFGSRIVPEDEFRSLGIMPITDAKIPGTHNTVMEMIRKIKMGESDIVEDHWDLNITPRDMKAISELVKYINEISDPEYPEFIKFISPENYDTFQTLEIHSVDEMLRKLMTPDAVKKLQGIKFGTWLVGQPEVPVPEVPEVKTWREWLFSSGSK